MHWNCRLFELTQGQHELTLNRMSRSAATLSVVWVFDFAVRQVDARHRCQVPSARVDAAHAIVAAGAVGAERLAAQAHDADQNV